MRVILLENVQALGAEGQVVDVPEGYAVNFLFPQHVATPALSEEVIEKRRGRPKAGGDDEEALAGEVDGAEVLLSVKVKDGRLKAPVTADDVRKELKHMGHGGIETAWITLPPIHDIGTFSGLIEFPSGLESEFTVVVEEDTGE